MYNSLSPTIISDFEWTCEDIFASSNLIFNETETSHNSSSSSPQLQNSKHGDIQNSSIGIKKVENSVKKSSHNEYERDRRKKLNKLYSSLRELLPEKDQRKKLSIPCSIARVLKYIPELKRNIERLIRKREELLLRASKDEFTPTYSNNIINPIISATCLSRREIMIQICILNTNSKIPFSMVAKIMEREGLEIMNATTHAANSDKTIYSLHVKAKEEMTMVGQILCERLMSSLTEQTVCSEIK